VPFAAYQALGQGVAIARGCANVLKLNCAFILVPVLRNFLSVLRGTWVNNFLPIDKNIVFHKYIGAWIMIVVLGHTLAHYTNYNKVSRFILLLLSKEKHQQLAALPAGVPLPPPLSAIVPQNAYVLAFTTLPVRFHKNFQKF
jgi:predicted ferric reductase